MEAFQLPGLVFGLFFLEIAKNCGIAAS